jgi:hypothetical protein
VSERVDGEQLPLELAPKTSPRRPRAGLHPSFHVRSHTTPEEVILGEVRAERQEDRVLSWMRTNLGRHTPWEVADAMGLHVVSARRAITNLTARGLLRRWPADRREAGPLRSKSSTWEAV